MLGHKRISRLSHRLPPLITLPQHGELPTQHRHPNAARGVPPGCSRAGCSGAMGTQGWAAPMPTMWVPMSWGTQSYRCLEPQGPLEVGCPRWGDRAASAIGMDGLQSICSLLCMYTHTHTHCLPCARCEGCRAWHSCWGRGARGLAPVHPGTVSCLASATGGWVAAGKPRAQALHAVSDTQDTPRDPPR